jgi:hypothetical protein
MDIEKASEASLVVRRERPASIALTAGNPTRKRSSVANATARTKGLARGDRTTLQTERKTVR